MNILERLLPKGGLAFIQHRTKSLTKWLAGIYDGMIAPIIPIQDQKFLDQFPTWTNKVSDWETATGILPKTGSRSVLEARFKAQGGQSPKYIQDTLRGAGFDVYVHEWWDPYTDATRNPLVFLSNGDGTVFKSQFGRVSTQFGGGPIVSGDFWQTKASVLDTAWNAAIETTQGAWAGRIVAISADNIQNKIIYSDDGGLTWTTPTVDITAFSNWFTIVETTQGAWAGRIVALRGNNSNNKAMYSDDGGVNWTEVAGVTNGAFYSLTETTQGAWAGRLVAVASSGNVLTSDDGGLTWVPRTAPANDWYSVIETTQGAWAGRLVAVAFSSSVANEKVMTSDDGGVNWTIRLSASDVIWRDLVETTQGAWAGRLVAVASSGTGDKIMTSDDGGVNWTPVAAPVDNQWWSICETISGRLVSVASSGTGDRVMVSDDGGVNWETRTSAVDNNWRFVLATRSTPWSGRLLAFAWSGTGDRIITSFSTYSTPGRTQFGSKFTQTGYALVNRPEQETTVIPSDPNTHPYFMYVGGQIFPFPALVPLSRKSEFERLLLTICPAHLWIGILISYSAPPTEFITLEDGTGSLLLEDGDLIGLE